MAFLSKYKGLTIRAIPNEKAKKKGFTRKYKSDWLSFKQYRQFLEAAIGENKEDYDVVMTNWEPNKYGFILISGERYIRGEIGKSLEDLSHGDEMPIASFVLDKAKVGHLEDKINWLIKEDTSAPILLKALKSIKAPFDNFDPIFLEGYFEGVVTKTGIKFLDFKNNPKYYS